METVVLMTHPHHPRPTSQVRRVVTPAQAGRLSVSGVSGSPAASTVRTPAQVNAEAAHHAADTIAAVPGIVRVLNPFLSTRSPRSVGDHRVEVRGDTLRASVVIDGQRPIPDVERDVRSAISRQWEGELDLEFADLELPGEQAEDEK